MIVFVAVSIYLPSAFMKPSYNFLYSVNSGYDQIYEVQGYHLVRKAYGTEYYNRLQNQTSPSLYLHDVKTNISRLIDFSEAQTLKIDPSNTSPDGYTVQSGGQSGGFFPFYWGGSSGDYYTRYLVGSTASKKLSLKGTAENYYLFQFYGWVLK